MSWSAYYKLVYTQLKEWNFHYSAERVPLQLGFRRFLGTWRISAREKSATLSKVVCRWWTLTYLRSWFYYTREMPIRRNRERNYNGKPVSSRRAKWHALTGYAVNADAVRVCQLLKTIKGLLSVWMGKSAKHLYFWNSLLKCKLIIQKITEKNDHEK